jgi:hypothetical protein
LRLLGASLPEGRRLSVRASAVRPDAEHWTLTLRTLLDGVPGERVLSGRSCRTVTDAAVLTLALTLNPELVLSDAEPPEQQQPPPPVSLPRSGTKPLETTMTAEQPRPQTRWLGRTLVGLRVGTLPDPDPELGVGVGLELGPFAAWLVASYAPPERVNSPAKPGAGATLWLQATALCGCYALLSDPVDIAPCAGIELARVEGTGYGVAHPRQGGVVYWFAPTVGLVAGIRLHRRLKVRLEGLGSAAVTRPEASLEPWGVLYRPEPLAVRVSMGVEVSFP